ncbi:MAG: hypothetical protein IKR56_10000 [Lachnospiraceae bacterium]|nr:hypothetical protein [Lachnospiraceae bacterium]MBR4175660.1 hypothetical protein [Lachnospiraceae bacterium]
MIFYRLAIDCIVLLLAYIIMQKRGKGHSVPFLCILMLLLTVEVYFIYRGQENSDLFFWHPYIVWSVSNLIFLVSGYIREKRDGIIKGRLLLGQFVVIPVLSAFTLSVGWLMKLYIR